MNVPRWFPETAVEAFEYQDGRLTGRIRIPAECPCMDGHFPGHPLLPGVAQLGILKALCEMALGRTARIHAVTRMKFTRQVLPGSVLEFHLDLSRDGGPVRFSLTEEGKVVSSGEFGIVLA